MFDMNGRIIRRGDYVRYEGQVCKVSYIFFKTIILDDGEKQIVLKSKFRKYPIKNLEVLNGHQHEITQSFISNQTIKRN